MSKEELKEILQTSHENELEDHKKYKEFSRQAYELGCEIISGVLNDLADDERTHAAVIAYALDKLEE